jgi:hypothetical protein
MKKPIKIGGEPWQSGSSSSQPKSPVKVELSAWDAISGLQEPSVIRQFDGMNELNSFAIKDEHATRNKNLTTTRYPALSVRKSGGALPSTLSAEVDGVAAREGELHVIAGGVWYKYNGDAWSTLRTGLDTSKKWSFVNFQGNFAANCLLATNGVDKALKYDGATVNPVSDLANAPAGANFIATHDNRVYVAVNSTVHFSALRKAEDWNTVNEAGQIVVETTDGKKITGLVAGSSRLTVFKQNSIHELFGNSPSNYQMKVVTENLGSPTGNSAQVIDGVIYFLGNDAVYRYSGGSMPAGDFSVQVRGTIGKINLAAADQSVSWQKGKKYYLAFPTGSHTNPDTVLEFDTEFNTWNTWSYPSPVSAKGAILDGVTYIGCVDGTIYKLDDAQTTDKGTPVPFEWVSKPFTYGSLAAKSRWYRMWVIADIPAESTLNVYVSSEHEGENWSLVKSITALTTIQAKEILIPTALVNHSNWVRIRLEGTGQVVVYEVSRQERVYPFGQS